MSSKDNVLSRFLPLAVGVTVALSALSFYYYYQTNSTEQKNAPYESSKSKISRCMLL